MNETNQTYFGENDFNDGNGGEDTAVDTSKEHGILLPLVTIPNLSQILAWFLACLLLAGIVWFTHWYTGLGRYAGEVPVPKSSQHTYDLEVLDDIA